MRHLLATLLILFCVPGSNISGQDLFQRPETDSSSFSNTFLSIGELQSPTQENLDLPQMPAVQPNATPGDFTPKLTGFFHLDAGYYHQSPINRIVLGDIEDGLGFRRARLAAKGQVADNVSYILEFDIAQSQARFVDVWMQAETGIGKIRIGRFRQPFGMSDLSSARELPFLERAVTFAQSPFRQTGIMIFDSTLDQRKTWAISGFRTLSDNFGNVYSDSNGYGLATRLTSIAGEWGENELVHLGAGFSLLSPGQGFVQIASSNEFFVGQNPTAGPVGLSSLPIVGVPPFVNTGPIAADLAQFFNLETALVRGNFAVQSEVRWVTVNESSGINHSFPGTYLQMRYVLTGESIPYSKTNGVLGRISPIQPLTRAGGLGALEIAGRFSHLDLTDSPGPGRRINNYTLGLNWYWNTHSKIQLNWIHSQLDGASLPKSTANTIAMRAQVDF